MEQFLVFSQVRSHRSGSRLLFNITENNPLRYSIFSYQGPFVVCQRKNAPAILWPGRFYWYAKITVLRNVNSLLELFP